MRQPVLLAFLVAVVSACGDDGAAAPDAAPARTCATDLITGVTFDLDPDGGPTQIHADVAFDGEAVWLVYNLPDGEGSGGFDVFARRIHCDGTAAGDRIQVTTTTGRNDIDPAVAIAGGRAHVVWQSDNNNNTGMNNLDIVHRSYQIDGTAIATADRDLETTRGGSPVPGNAFYPDVAALPDGGMVIAGVRGLDETGTFQAFVQRIDAGGGLDGEAIDGQIENGVTHLWAAAAATADGTTYVAWVRSPATEEDYVVHTSLPDGAAALDPSPPIQAVTAQASAPSYAALGERAYLAVASDSAIVLLDGSDLDGTASSLSFDDAGRLDHTPTVAAAPGGGAVAWYKNISGIRNDMFVQPFSFDGITFTAGWDVEVPGGPMPPYPPAITHVKDGVYFVAWSEGTSPDFYLKGTFLQLD